MSEEHTPVLIVGGSLVGLSAAVFLRRQGIDVILVERHPSTSIHPRTPGYNARTMELFRAAGIEDAVRDAGPWQLNDSGLLWAETLTSANHRWLRPGNMHGPDDDFSEVSPSDFVALAQDKLELVLREAAERLGADCRYNTELVSFTPDADGVTAILTDRNTGNRRSVRAQYVIAADGAASPIRTRLAINRIGVGVLEHKVGIMVRADLREALQDKSFVICQVENPEVSAMVRIVGDLVSLNVSYDPENGAAADQFTPQRCVELTRAVAGIPDLPVEPVDVLPWQPTAAVAEQFADGRVFLAGDAAHVMPPSGAFGANTGIQDAYNLSWKLAAVLRGWAGPELLTSYDSERRPVAELTVDQALARGREWFQADYPNGATPTTLIDDLTLMFGYRYRSTAILGETPGLGGPCGIDNPRNPTWEAGSRVPHKWLEGNAQKMSTVDLWASGFALFTGPDGHPWLRAAEEISDHDGPPVLTHSGSFSGETWWHAAGISPEGAILVRPDGFIAWRTETLSEQPARTLRHALHRILGTDRGRPEHS